MTGILPRELVSQVKLLSVVWSLGGGGVRCIEEPGSCSRSISYEGRVAQTGAGVVGSDVLSNQLKHVW
jgi:hypothetical protein